MTAFHEPSSEGLRTVWLARCAADGCTTIELVGGTWSSSRAARILEEQRGWKLWRSMGHDPVQPATPYCPKHHPDRAEHP